jgi:hypothetical protein
MSQQNYPEKTCEIERLVTHPKLVEAALAGTKTQQRRNGIYGYPGEEFELEGTKFVITDLNHVRLGDMTEEDARAEGFPNIAFYRDVIIKMHAGMEWDEDHLVWLHEFKIVA